MFLIVLPFQFGIKMPIHHKQTIYTYSLMYKSILKHGIVNRVLIALFICAGFLVQNAQAQSNSHKGEAVLLIHGFLGSPDDLADIARELRREGYFTISPEFDTRTQTIEQMAKSVIFAASAHGMDAKVMHVVTHSMGGILLRAYLEDHSIPNLGRVVMIAPPNSGSQVAGELSQYNLYRRFFGPAGAELANIKLTPRKLGNYELGIIAGTASVNPIFSQILPGPDDGYVALSSTPLAGMNDFITIPSSHGLITGNEGTIEQVSIFLETGRFDHKMPLRGIPNSTQDVLDFYAPKLKAFQ